MSLPLRPVSPRPRPHRLGWLSIAVLLLCTGALAAGDFDGRPEVQAFIQEMVQRHGFDAGELTTLLGRAERKQSILDAISRPAESKPWFEYRPIFVNRARIEGGVAFWEQHQALLQQVRDTFGVDPGIVVAIIGVETRYGRHTGRYRVIDALSTLAFDYPKRGPFFRGELEQFLLLTREEAMDPASVLGSYAGAMGAGQFIPSSYRRYAVDFDDDGQRDLWHSERDAIASVANYLRHHGWRLQAPVADRARLNGADPGPLLAHGLKPQLTPAQLKALGVDAEHGLPAQGSLALIALEDRDGPQYWLGYPNFYVITRYNRSPLYAMAVHQLAEAITAEREAAAGEL